MSPHTLLRLYPRKWREKYGDEFLALLEQADAGWRATFDVVPAALREWARALTPAMALFAFVYALLWISFGVLHAAIPLPFPSFLSMADHGTVITTFLAAALVSRIIDTNVFSGAGAVQSKAAVHTVHLLTFTLVSLLGWIASVLIPGVALRSPAITLVVMPAIMFGHRPAMRRLLSEVPDFPPRPPSFTRLGLSA